MINFVLKTISDIYFGNKSIGQGYYGNTLVYQKTQPVVNAVVFTAKADNSTLGLTRKSSYQTLQYSTNCRTWNTFDTSTSISLNTGDKVYVRGILSRNNNTSNYTQFSTTSGSDFKVSGNINTIFDYTAVDLGSTFSLYDYCGYFLFRECLISDASELLLPSTTLSSNCYNNMFRGTNITTAPTLPATTLAADCYNTMFKSCYNLTTAPTLPATTLATQCYRSMFANCRSLTTPPELPATTLAIGCYYEMFAGDIYGSDYCGLTTAPVLPATTLTSSCYYAMFQRCTSLNYIECYATDISANNCTYGWVNGVASSGTFVKDASMYDWTTGNNGIPTNWTVVADYDRYITFTANDTSTVGLTSKSSHQSLEYSTDTVTWVTMTTSTTINLNTGDKVYVRGILSGNNSLNDTTQFNTTGDLKLSGSINALWDYTAADLGSAFTLRAYCGSQLFRICTALTDVSKLYLPSTILSENCYTAMFYGCTGLTSAPALPATTLAEQCYLIMFQNCSSLTTAPTLPATTLADYCYNGMFRGCSSLTTAPALNATTLAQNCYYRMFYNCTSLTTAPALNATTLSKQCYDEMFYNCSSLTTAPVLPATTLVDGCYNFMFEGCSSLTTAPALPATTLIAYCYDGMFMDCSSLTTAPVLPATTLKPYCYLQMFRNCSSLNRIECYATDISANNCTQNWVKNVAATGTFIKNNDMSDWTTGDNGIPTGWTVPVSDDPFVTFTANASSQIKLNAKSTYQTTLEYSTDKTNWSTMSTSTTINLNTGDKAYIRGILAQNNTGSRYTKFIITGDVSMSGNINALWSYSNLTVALKNYCGYCTFQDCTGLTDISGVKFPDNVAQYCYRSLFERCTNITAIPTILPATTLAQNCYDRMFQDCDSLVDVSYLQLPATTLATGCYYQMFKACDNLEKGPDLNAATISTQGYYCMFQNCTKLNYIKCLATSRVSSNSTQNWVQNVASSGTFVKDANATFWSTGANGIPNGWTTQDA